MPRSRRFVRQTLSLDLTPMVDVVFLLIIFFMVSTTFISVPSISEQLFRPTDPSSQLQDPDAQVVRIDADGLYYVRGVLTDKANLEESLRALRSNSDVDWVIVRVNRDRFYQEYIELRGLLTLVGFKQIRVPVGN